MSAGDAQCPEDALCARGAANMPWSLLCDGTLRAVVEWGEEVGRWLKRRRLTAVRRS